MILDIAFGHPVVKMDVQFWYRVWYRDTKSDLDISSSQWKFSSRCWEVWIFGLCIWTFCNVQVSRWLVLSLGSLLPDSWLLRYYHVKLLGSLEQFKPCLCIHRFWFAHSVSKDSSRPADTFPRVPLALGRPSLALRFTLLSPLFCFILGPLGIAQAISTPTLLPFFRYWLPMRNEGVAQIQAPTRLSSAQQDPFFSTVSTMTPHRINYVISVVWFFYALQLQGSLV